MLVSRQKTTSIGKVNNLFLKTWVCKCAAAKPLDSTHGSERTLQLALHDVSGGQCAATVDAQAAVNEHFTVVYACVFNEAVHLFEVLQNVVETPVLSKEVEVFVVVVVQFQPRRIAPNVTISGVDDVCDLQVFKQRYILGVLFCADVQVWQQSCRLYNIQKSIHKMMTCVINAHVCSHADCEIHVHELNFVKYVSTWINLYVSLDVLSITICHSALRSLMGEGVALIM